MRKNVASQTIAFQMTLATDGTTAVTSGTPTVYYTIDGGTQGTGAGTAAHEGNGQWSYSPAQAETNGDHVIFTMVLATAITQAVQVYPVSYDPTDAALGLNNVAAADVNAQCDTAISDAALATAAALATVDSNVDAILVDTGTTIPGVLGTPAGADIAADIAAIKVDTAAILVDTDATIPGLIGTPVADLATDIAGVQTDTTAIVADTNELQTDWADGGRLDLIIDAILVDTATLGAPAGASHAADIAAIKAETSLIVADTNELQTDWADGGRLDLIVDAILVDTAEIGAAGAGLTSIFTTAMTESYAADGAAPTPAQSLFLIQQALTEVAIVSTTETIKKLDGSTAAATLTLDDASNPTSKTRAT